MSGPAEDLWREVEEITKYHREKKGENVERWLNRMLDKLRERESVPPGHWKYEDCSLTVAMLPMSQLRTFTRTKKKQPHSDEAKLLVVVEIQSRLHLLDGGKRINKWEAAGETKSRPAIIITNPTLMA